MAVVVNWKVKPPMRNSVVWDRNVDHGMFVKNVHEVELGLKIKNEVDYSTDMGLFIMS